MAQERVAGDIRRAAQIKLLGEPRCALVEALHPTHHLGHILCRGQLALERRGGHAKPKRLGQHQAVAWPQPAFGQGAPRVDKAHHHQAVFRLFILDGMPAGDHHPGLARFFGPAAHDFAQQIRRADPAEAPRY